MDVVSLYQSELGELAFKISGKMVAKGRIPSSSVKPIPYPHLNVVLSIEDKFGFVVDLVIGTEDCGMETGWIRSLDGRGLT